MSAILLGILYVQSVFLKDNVIMIMAMSILRICLFIYPFSYLFIYVSTNISLISTAFQARLQQYINRELSDVQADFRKGRGTRDQIANIPWIIEKQENSRKLSISALLTIPKPFTVWITINCGRFWKRWEYRTTWPTSWETWMQVRKQQLEVDMEQQTGSK